MNASTDNPLRGAPRILAIVMAGGEGTRLHPLTADRSKPAVPFGGRYRIVDFVLSNLVNSGINAIYLLVQYKSQSLIEHVRKAWQLSPVIPTHFVTVVPPQMREGPEWFRGTADAVYQNLNLIDQHQPGPGGGVRRRSRLSDGRAADGARSTCRRGADVTVAALPVPRAEACGFGIIDADARRPHPRLPRETRRRRRRCPTGRATPTPRWATTCSAPRLLVKTLQALRRGGDADFGTPRAAQAGAELPRLCLRLVRQRRARRQRGEETAYWRDVGTLDAYFKATQDVLGAAPRFNLFNPQWPVFSSNYQGPDANVVNGSIDNSVIAGGTIVHGARIHNSMVRSEVMLEPDAELDECIVMDYVTIKRGCRLRRVIVRQLQHAGRRDRHRLRHGRRSQPLLHRRGLGPGRRAAGAAQLCHRFLLRGGMVSPRQRDRARRHAVEGG